MSFIEVDELACHWVEGCEPLLTEGNAGIDLRARERTMITRGVSKIPTGFYVEIPPGFCGMLLPRSGSAKTGLTLANTAGIIDETYRGEVLCKVKKDWDNYPDVELIIEAGERFCQMVIIPYLAVKKLDFVDELSETDRGDSGFGSSGRH